MNVLPAYTWSLCVSVGSPGTGVMDGCEPQCGCWESNLSSLCLSSKCCLTAKSYLQPHKQISF